MIEPTEGRIVHFHPHVDEGHPPGTKHAAIVAGVLDSRSVNLAIFSSSGALYSKQAVQLLQDDDVAPAAGHYAEWMAFQKGQAVKTEAAQAVAAPSLDQVHSRISDIETAVDGKFTELGDYLQKAFAGFEQRLGTLTQTPVTEAQTAAADAGTDVSGAGQQAAT